MAYHEAFSEARISPRPPRLPRSSSGHQDQFEFDSKHYPEDKPKHQGFERCQFQTVSDFVVLQEVCDYILLHVGNITEHHVEFWRKRRMGKDEKPLSAYAKLKDDAATLAQTILTFRPDIEVYNIVTRAGLPGGTFFPEALFEEVERIMQHKKHDYDERDPDYYTQIADLWAAHAQKEATDAAGRKPDLNAQIIIELNRRGFPPSWSDADKMILKELATPKNDKPAAKAEGGQGGGKSRFHCTYCKRDGHTVQRCRIKAKDMAAQSEAQRPSTPTVATVTPGGATSDPLSQVWKSDSKLGQRTRQQQGGGGGGGGQNASRLPVCDVCTRLNGGQEVRHFVRYQCAFADQSKRPPDNLNVKEPKLRAILSRMRKEHGMPELPPWQPRPPPRVGVLLAAQVPEPSVMTTPLRSLLGTRFAAPMYPMYSASQARAVSQLVPAKEAVAFNDKQRHFTCLGCLGRCHMTLVFTAYLPGFTA
jgi:hypothetical protein